MKIDPVRFLLYLLFSLVYISDQRQCIAEDPSPISFKITDDSVTPKELLSRYDTLIPAFNGLFITHQEIKTKGDTSPSKLYAFDYIRSAHPHKWGVIDSSGKVILPFICDGIKALSANEGIAAVFVDSHSLNTGIPRYRYQGNYFLFDRNGQRTGAELPFELTVVFLSDWHYEDFVITQGPAFYLPEGYRTVKKH